MACDDREESGRGLWQYPDELADALERFGLAPSSHTPPLMVRTALNGLYRYELRRLRDRLLARQIQKPDYLAQVIVLRKKYWPLSLLPAAWERILSRRPLSTSATRDTGQGRKDESGQPARSGSQRSPVVRIR